MHPGAGGGAYVARCISWREVCVHSMYGKEIRLPSALLEDSVHICAYPKPDESDITKLFRTLPVSLLSSSFELRTLVICLCRREIAV